MKSTDDESYFNPSLDKNMVKFLISNKNVIDNNNLPNPKCKNAFRRDLFMKYLKYE